MKKGSLSVKSPSTANALGPDNDQFETKCTSGLCCKKKRELGSLCALRWKKVALIQFCNECVNSTYDHLTTDEWSTGNAETKRIRVGPKASCESAAVVLLIWADISPEECSCVCTIVICFTPWPRPQIVFHTCEKGESSPARPFLQTASRHKL